MKRAKADSRMMECAPGMLLSVSLPMPQAMVLVMTARAGSRRDGLGDGLRQGHQGEAQAEAEQI